ncbi:ribose-phosphate diphosphokinase [Streptomyces cyaneus]|uniref:ribose-phosphate diphosphokinase n=1 Tax=Streptomyces cyaneus TaxID=1904 RepID=UPI000FF88127|nr:ribose-phosphate diphosphokinase [Streptomyces cyaneus]
MSTGDDYSLFVVPGTGDANQTFASSLSDKLGLPVTDHGRTVFKSGEMIVSLPAEVSETAVIVLAPSFRPSDAILELLLLADALRRHGVRSLTCVLQYVPYSRSNRLNRPGLPLGSKVVISMLEQSPIDRFVVFDLHARETLGYFSKPVTWIPTLQLMSDAIPLHAPEVVVSPDRGRYDDCMQISTMRSCTLDMLMKVRRDDSGSSELVAGARTDLNGRSVLLFDDEIWSGVTAAHATESLFAAGAARIDYLTVYDFTTPDIRKNMLENLGISSFTTTNLAHHGNDPFDGRYRILDAADLVVRAWPRITGGSARR